MKTYIKILVCLLVIVSTGPAAEVPAEVPSALLVEVRVFSGMPPPMFLITDAKDIQEVINLVNRCQKNDRFADKFVGGKDVGYKGFYIENTSQISPELEAFTVFRSDIQILKFKGTSEPDSEFRKDEGALLEKRLIQFLEASGVVKSDVLEWIKTGKLPGHTSPNEKKAAKSKPQ